MASSASSWKPVTAHGIVRKFKRALSPASVRRVFSHPYTQALVNLSFLAGGALALRDVHKFSRRANGVK